MTTWTANHLHLMVNTVCTTGPWVGETGNFNLNFSVNGGGGINNVNRPGLNDGQITLNTFDVHTSATTRSLTVDTMAGSVQENWVGDDNPVEEKVTSNDIDFLLGQGAHIWGQLGNVAPDSWKLGDVRLYACGPDPDDSAKHPSVAPLGPNIWTPTLTWAGGSTSAELSPEVALCVSFYSAVRAKKGRGRIYLGPLTVDAFAIDGLTSSVWKNNVPSAVAATFQNVRARGTPGSSACYCPIIFNTHGFKGGPPHGTQGVIINKIRTGDEMDHQERRTKKRAETFAEIALT